MNSLSTQSYKGTRDYYPEQKRVQNYIFSVWSQTAKKFGYEEYGAPLLEPLEVYTAKSGQELATEQTYAFTDRGDRSVAIRPEMTPSISRMVAARRQELAYPARLYSIANFMRYERPQRGREREFWQLNVDVFGAEGPTPEAEIVQLGVETMRAFGAKDELYLVKLNNRRLIDAMMQEYLGLDTVQAQLMIKLFDRKNKISNEDFRDQAIDILGEEKRDEGLSKIAKLILTKNIDDLPESVLKNEAAQELRDVMKMLEARGITNAVFDVTLMRGFDYYTGTVFEFFDTHPDNNRSLFGGGRYDGLVGLFGAEPLSAVGFAPGLTMTELFLESHRLLPELRSTTEVYMAVLGEGAQAPAQEIVTKLRSENVRVEVDITGRKLDKQIKTAIKKDITYLMFVGEEDIKNESYNFKDTKTGNEEKLGIERIITRVKDHRRAASDDLADLLDDPV